MPILLISCATLPPVTISSIPIYVFAKANEMLAKEDTEEYYPCCGKTICRGCLYSSIKSGNYKCPFCNAKRIGRTDRELVADMRKRVAANDAASICMLAGYCYQGLGGVQQDHIKAIELFTKSADLGSCRAHYFLAKHYNEGGEMKKAKFHLEAAAMAGNEIARNNLGTDECNDGNIEQAVKHWIIGASAGGYHAMHNLRLFFEKGLVSRDTINSTLAAYNSSCAEMRSEDRDAAIRIMAEAGSRGRL
jgi:TPR repeat protein